MDYRNAGVDIEKSRRVVEKIGRWVEDIGGKIGHFAGGMTFNSGNFKIPKILVTIDGVGTKALIASEMRMWEIIGRDVVHHCINDVAVCGAEPLMFVDYIAMGTLEEEVVEKVIQGVINSCRDWGVILAGGETAEMPDVYLPRALDIVGCLIGVVEEEEFIEGKGVQPGDLLIGFPSTGLHTNGYSLARKIIARKGWSYNDFIEELNATLGEALLAEHRCYLPEIRRLKSNYHPKAFAHITGGGLIANTIRVIPKGMKLDVMWGSWSVPPIFLLLQEWGEVTEDEMRRVFNLGVGLIAVLDATEGKRFLSEPSNNI
ncbi:MAG: phosphoribosylformylglycinamidine cyclo-ligase [bacterium]